MNRIVLKDRTKKLAIDVISLRKKFPHNEEAWIIGRQLMRSATSVGANYRAACRMRTTKELIAKLGIVIEEVDETAYWLELTLELKLVPQESVNHLWDEADQLTRIFNATRYSLLQKN